MKVNIFVLYLMISSSLLFSNENKNYEGEIYLKNDSVIESDFIQQNDKLIIYNDLKSNSLDSINKSEVNFIRADIGNYLLEGTALGVVALNAIYLSAISNDLSKASWRHVFYLSSAGAVIGGIWGLFTSRNITIRMNKRYTVSLFSISNNTQLRFKSYNLLSFSYNF